MKLHGYACGCAGCSHPDAHPAILQSNTWPSGKQTIQYSFSTSDWTGDAVRNGAITHSLTAWFQERVRDAMEAWEEVCSVRFVEVADGPDVDIRIGAGPQIWIPQIGTYSTGYYRTTEFDAFGNTQEGMVVFQVTSDWGTDPDTRFYDLALHEVGHALGLAHSELEGKVMSGPPYSSYGDVDAGRDRLTADDIAGARELFPDTTTGPTSGNDTLAGTDRHDVIRGLGGDDVIRGRGGNDSLYGGGGNDSLYGGSGNDWLSGGTGVDTFFFAPGHGADTIGDFHALGDRIDLSDFGRSAPTWAQLQDSAAAVGNGVRLDLAAHGGGTISLESTTLRELAASDFIGLSADVRPDPPVNFDTERVGTGGDDTLAGADGSDDSLSGGNGEDVLDGRGGWDWLEGGGHDDVLLGKAGNDSLFGDAGRDVLKGGGGADWLDGGAGGDFLFGWRGNDFIRGGPGSDWVEAGDGNDTIHGGDGNPDVLAGQAGDDRLIGESGNDRLWGGGGNDTLLGGAGGDSALAGGNGNDSVDGGAGDDRLLGGAGRDTLIGGPDDDTFRFNSWEGGGRDLVRDYGNGDDVIELNLPKGNDGSGLSFRAEAGGTLIAGGNVEVLVLGPDAAGLTLSEVEIV